MIRAIVTIIFDADSEQDAETQVESWQFHEGAQVTMTINSVRTGIADHKGQVDLETPSTSTPPPPSMNP